VIIDRVIITNFGPFQGSTQIDLSPEGKKNIALIIGHGGAGKTNVGKAIRWALYNLKFEGTGGGVEYHKEDVLGLFFRDGGGAAANKPPTETNLSVKLEISPGQAVQPALSARGLKFGKYSLERSASVRNIAPTARDVMLSPVTVKGPDQRQLSDPEGFIEEFLLPASTSTFFMFHGDRIRDLTAQIDEPVIESIKQILDVTAMNNAVSDLRAVMGRLARQVAATSKDQQQRMLKQTTWDRQDADEKKELLNKKEKQELLDQTRDAIKKLDSEQGELLEAAGLLTECTSKEIIKKNLEEERDGVKQQLDTLIDQVPKEILYHTLHGRALDLREKDASNEAHKGKISELNTKKNQLKDLLRQRRCPVCKQPYPDSLLDSYKKEITRIDSDISREERAVKPLDPALAEIMEIIIRFESSRYDPKVLQMKRHEYHVRITDLEIEIEKKKSRLKKFASAEIRRQAKLVESSIKQKIFEEGRLETAIKQLDTNIILIQKYKSGLQKDLLKLGGGGSQLPKKQYDLAEALQNTFEEAVIELANDKRHEIARETGDMLMKVTIKPELFHKTNPVDVDENFQVKAMNYERNPLVWTVESSSEREVLAVSFIYGLLKASEREASVILDTFFGNLDPNQIRNLTANLSLFGSQVVLMTTDTEFLELLREAPPSFWQHVCRYIFLNNSVRTNFVTMTKVITNLKEAEKEALEQKRDFARKEVKK